MELDYRSLVDVELMYLDKFLVDKIDEWVEEMIQPINDFARCFSNKVEYDHER